MVSEQQRFPDELFASIPKWVEGDLLLTTSPLRFTFNSRLSACSVLVAGTPLLFLGFTKWCSLNRVRAPVAAARNAYGSTDVCFAVITPLGIGWRFVTIHENDFIKRFNDKAT